MRRAHITVSVFPKEPKRDAGRDAVFRECSPFQTSDLLLWGVDHTIHTAHWTAGLRERKGKSTCFAVAEPLLTLPRAVPRSSWLGAGARAPSLPLLRATELVPQ